MFSKDNQKKCGPGAWLKAYTHWLWKGDGVCMYVCTCVYVYVFLKLDGKKRLDQDKSKTDTRSSHQTLLKIISLAT